MKGLEFPLVGTKVAGLTKKFDLTDLHSRREYFEAKTGKEITKLKDFLETGVFMAFLVGKKASGKGTRAGMFAEVFGWDKVALISAGDIVREVHGELKTASGRKDVQDYLEKNYRGYISVNEGIKAILGRSQDRVSVPDEIMLALMKREIAKHPGKAIFVDGFPRTLDQISYSLFFRDLARFRDDPDVFILIDTPLSVIDERIKYRVVCPKCKISRNIRLHITRDIDYDSDSGNFVMHCDNPSCQRAVMIAKEGDNLGVEPIKGRLETDEKVLRSVLGIHGVPKVTLRTHVPVEKANSLFDEYEFTPEYVLSKDLKSRKVRVDEKIWVVKDDNDVASYSLVAAVDVVLMIKQLADILGL
ncbi:MAG: hypothetical protein UX91_C0003G0081 [Candidatus Amesbacteria bacterium GW2011_GWB1_47_19]|nr:MAG: hypothetical protein UW51_C0003G0087 [Candidatus Amesbacteria bacterium GW2011_GWA1_44_24]KKU31512.1 MAG: hypothetical protein UX46_C0005G0081 [Candidatus Amesbacteria bacterium GW2011_GWC1_46_24]KKU67520.1 MAG: hypothetical protein UX91_C0003G0081 [Candidatus Amesbacteria bacterium GW2011_GWB1_47_19]OGD06201.1 MAG: hypothetical protein A2379_01345 [Candidatus Amesbacteria bacterium RIFOXYB1_FULL_47_13]HBC72532.1 hypothetical protein [Candidatus Amesbacteria bacterium]